MAANVLFFHTGTSSFVDKDARILQKLGVVHQFNFASASKAATPLLFIRQLFFLIRHLPAAKISVSQFSGYHAFLPALLSRILGKPFLIISGGTDCHSFPVIGYGHLRKGLLGRFTRWSYRLATHISPKHQTLWECDYSYDTKEPDRQGIHAFIPDLRTPYTVIPNGYDTEFWKRNPSIIRKQRSFVTVSAGFHYRFQQQLKGIDLILSVAPVFPDCEFTIIGVPENLHFQKVPSNVTLLPPATARQLVDCFSAHAFYLQLSMAEGFPNALCEAMSCECVPIGSAVFSIPEIIGSSGYLLMKRNEKDLCEVFRKALSEYDERIGNSARNSIQERFSIGRREKALLALCASLI